MSRFSETFPLKTIHIDPYSTFDNHYVKSYSDLKNDFNQWRDRGIYEQRRAPAHEQNPIAQRQPLE